MTDIDYHNPGKEFLHNINVHDLLPQQEPFVMVSRLAHYDDSSVTTETDIATDNIFVDDGALSTAGMIENIAQTCAARIGYVNKYILKKGVQIGVIGAVRKFRVNSHPKAGSTIVTTVNIIEELLGMTLAMATVSCGDDVLATTQIKLAVKEKDE